MAQGEMVGSTEATLWLPPRDTWLYDPIEKGPLETPTDSLGLVDLDKLVALVKSTVSPSFSWAAPRNDIHHLQYYARLYTTDIEIEFRELLSRKVKTSRTFHNWLHMVTIPSPVPTEDVMYESIQVERIKVGLAQAAGLAMKIARIPYIPEHKRSQRLEEIYNEYMLHYENARGIPPEFNQLSLDELAVESIEDLLGVTKRLGKQALNHIPVRHREILQAA